MSIILFILVLSFLVIIHELGHFIAAKWAKVKVDEFGIGYPPKLLKLFSWKGTDFTINWIPFGGFVRMQGEDEYSSVAEEKNQGKDQKSSNQNQFYQVSIFKRLVIILAGASVNFIFGVIAFTIVFSKMGIPEFISEPRIGEIAINSPAEKAGMTTNTNVVAIQVNDQERINIDSPSQLIEQVSEHKGETVKIFTSGTCKMLVCDQTETEYEVYLRTDEETPSDQGSLGLVFDQIIYTFYPSWEMPFRSAAYGLEQAMNLGVQIVQTFSSVIFNIFMQGKVSNDVAGPIGIIHQAESIGIFEQGFLTILSFSGMLSINLAVMNVLPFPPLDGGRAIFVLLQLFLNKKRTEKLEYYLNYGGYIFFLGLIVFISIKDVFRIFGK